MAAYFAVLAAGRHRPGHEPRPRRSPDPRHRRSTSRAGCTGSSPTASTARTRAHRLRRSSSEVAEVAPEEIIVAGASAYPRIIDFARLPRIAHEVGALLLVDMAHIAGTRRRGPASQPVPARRHRHHHDPQDPARPARRHGLSPNAENRAIRRKSTSSDRQGRVPRHPGRAADARHRRQGGRASASAAAGVPPTTARIIDNAQALAGRSLTPGRGSSSAAAPTTTSMLVDLTPLGITGNEAENALDDAGITVNKNAIPFDTHPPKSRAASASARRRSPPAAWARPRCADRRLDR